MFFSRSPVLSDPAASADGAPLTRRSVTVTHPDGLHLRPLTEITKLAATLPCKVVLRKGEAAADASAMIQLMTLAAACGDEVTVEAAGPDAGRAVDAVAALVAPPAP